MSEDRLDVAFRPGAERLQAANDSPGISRLAKTLERSRPELIVLEASGGYETALLEKLLAKRLRVALLNPRQVRQFARASERLAKTDAIDAAVLAHFAEVMKPEPRRLADADTRRLRALVARRCQLIQMMTAELHRAAMLRDGFLLTTICCLKKQLANTDKQLARLIQEAPALRDKAELLPHHAWNWRGCFHNLACA